MFSNALITCTHAGLFSGIHNIKGFSLLRVVFGLFVFGELTSREVISKHSWYQFQCKESTVLLSFLIVTMLRCVQV